MSDGPGEVIPLPVEEQPPQPGAAPQARRLDLHGLAVAGMALSALTGIAALFLFATVNWPGQIGRYFVTAFVVSVLVFLVCSAAAVFSAARG